jgi:hypothetical protein
MNAGVVARAGLVAAIALGAPASAFYWQYAGEPHPAISVLPSIAYHERHRHLHHRRQKAARDVDPSPAPSEMIPHDSVSFVGGGGVVAADPPAAVEPIATPIPQTPSPPVVDTPTQPPADPTAYPTSAPVVTPSPSPRSPSPIAVPAVSSGGVHMLDATGCQAFPSSDVFNRPVTEAAVVANSTGYIDQAMSHGSGGMGINGPYHYAIVPTDAATVTIRPQVSYHSFPYAWPIPSNGSTLASTGDASMILVQQTSPSCTVYDGFSFQDNGGSWSGYSGARVSMGENMVRETCDGVEGLCSEHIEADLTYYEATHGAVQPILHALHGETPSNIGCDPSSFSNCIPVGARLRLHANYPLPSDPNARAVIVDLQTYGFNNADNGCCWNISGLNTLQQPNSYPAPVMAAIGGLRWSDFDVVAASD